MDPLTKTIIYLVQTAASGASPLEALASWVGGMLLNVTGWFLGLSGVLLEISFKYTIVDMSETIRKLPALYTAWAAFRDLSNIFFIFIILYIAIYTILGLDTSTTKKTLVHVVIVGLLLNFSLFFTKILIDASNILALRFHQVIINSGSNGLGIAGAFMQKLGLQDFASSLGAATVLSSVNGSVNILLVGILSSILFLIVAFIFGAMAIMLIARFIILVFLMILSPLAFMSMALPGASRHLSKWTKHLISQLIFAPAMLAFIWVTLVVLSGLFPGSAIGGEGGSLADLLPRDNTGPGFIESKIIIILNFMIVIGMAIFSLFAAKELGATGANRAISIGKKWARGARRNLVGRPTRYFGGVAYRGAVRRTGLRKLYEKAGETGAFQISKNKWVNRLGLGTAAHDVMEGTLGRVVKTKVGGTSALESHEQIERLKTVRESIDRVKDFRDKLKEAREIKGNDEASRKKRADIIGAVTAKISPEAFVGALHEEEFFNPDVMRYATTSQYMALMKSNRLTEDQKIRSTKARNQFIREGINTWRDANKKHDADLAEYNKKIASGEIDKNTPPPEKPKEASYPGDVRKKIKYNTPLSELEMMNRYDSEMFEGDKNDPDYDPVSFIMHIPSGIIKDIRKSESFSPGQGEEIRLKKYDDFYQITKDLKKEEDDEDGKIIREYFGKGKEMIEKKRKEMRVAFGGKSIEELAGAPGGAIWKTGAFMDVMSRGALEGWRGKDEGEKEIVIRHMLRAEQIAKEPGKEWALTPEMKDALNWLRFDKDKGGRFYNTSTLEGSLGIQRPNKPYEIKVDLQSVKSDTAPTASGEGEKPAEKPTIRVNLEPKPEEQSGEGENI